jgi:hypothetical protein
MFHSYKVIPKSRSLRSGGICFVENRPPGSAHPAPSCSRTLCYGTKTGPRWLRGSCLSPTAARGRRAVYDEASRQPVTGSRPRGLVRRRGGVVRLPVLGHLRDRVLLPGGLDLLVPAPVHRGQLQPARRPGQRLGVLGLPHRLLLRRGRAQPDHAAMAPPAVLRGVEVPADRGGQRRPSVTMRV